MKIYYNINGVLQKYSLEHHKIKLLTIFVILFTMILVSYYDTIVTPNFEL